jgi:hypothetical protein
MSSMIGLLIRFETSVGTLRIQRGSIDISTWVLVSIFWHYLEILNPVQESIFIFQKFIVQAFAYSFVAR